MDNRGDYVAPWYWPKGGKFQIGPSEFDHKHRLVLSWVWDLPKVASSNGFTKAILNGWQFRIRERFGTQFRAEFFNIFNQVNFDNPGGSGGTSISANMSVGQGGFG